MDLDVRYKRKRGVKAESKIWDLSKDKVAIYYSEKSIWAAGLGH